RTRAPFLSARAGGRRLQLVRPTCFQQGARAPSEQAHLIRRQGAVSERPDSRLLRREAGHRNLAVVRQTSLKREGSRFVKLMLIPMVFSGCLASYHHSYAIGVVGFTPTERAAIVDGARRWEIACGGNSRLTFHDDCNFNHDSDICILPKRLKDHLAITDRRYNIFDSPPTSIYID